MKDRVIKAKYAYEALAASVKLELIKAGVEAEKVDELADKIFAITFKAIYKFKQEK
ncbi:MAG: hypothetical protein ACRCZ2_04145 [Fusobacteriaceae bacterium]